MDVGLIFIGNARLRRAVDAAAISAALQYRQGFDTTSLTNAADEFLQLNGFSSATAKVDDCITQPADTTLCTTPPRKLVRVYATTPINLAFLPVIGVNSIIISATATSETASLDVVLVIDRSESMTYDAKTKDATTGDYIDPMRDPYYCNTPSVNGLSNAVRTYTSTVYNSVTHSYPTYVLTSACKPFFSVIGAAIDFTDILLFPYDQMSIVTFDKDAGVVQTDPITGKSTRVPNLALGADCPDPNNCTANNVVIPALENLTVFQGGATTGDPNGANSIFNGAGSAAPARCYDNRAVKAMNCSPAICMDSPVWTPSPPNTTPYTNYKGLLGAGEDACPSVNPTFNPPADPSHYTTTNIGAGLKMAGDQLASDTRQDVLWVVILLTDGVPNAGYSDTAIDPNTLLPLTFCPSSTWGNISPNLPVCDNGNVALDWNNGITTGTTRTRPLSTNSAYDALSYAFDQADYVGLPYNATTGAGGQDALVYTIGLGTELTNYKIASFTDPVTGNVNEGLGTIFLNYAAMVGRGQYFPAPTATQLNTIFREIGSNIAVRLAK
jgi:hypothetical protein